MQQALLVATLTEPLPDGRGSSLPQVARVLEIRADRVGDVGPDIGSGFRGRLLYSLRSRREGGAFEGGLDARHDRLIAAAEGHHYVELEAERDLVARVLERIPARRRVISWHGTADDPCDIGPRLAALDRASAQLYRFVPFAPRVSDAVATLRRLASLGRRDATAFASGPAGSWTRVVAPRLGACVAFGAAGAEDASAGEISVARLVDDYGLPSLRPARALFGIAGAAVARSLSPRLHNAAYRAASIPALYVSFVVERFEDLWSEEVRESFVALGLPLEGLTVASPCKEAALAVAADASVMARRAGAANALLRRGPAWLADTTDPEGVADPLHARGIEVARRRVAIVGCGGAGRAAAAAFVQSGAEVTLVNRGAERGRFAAGLLGLPLVPLADFVAGDYSIVVNATPCSGQRGELPFDVEALAGGAVVVDLVYGAEPTPFVRAALARGHTTIDGKEVLLAEVRRQFHLMTGQSMRSAEAGALAGDPRKSETKVTA